MRLTRVGAIDLTKSRKPCGGWSHLSLLETDAAVPAAVAADQS